MDPDILNEAINSMRGEMRGRVGKKLLTIEISTPEEGGEPEATVEKPGEEEEATEGE